MAERPKRQPEQAVKGVRMDGNIIQNEPAAQNEPNGEGAQQNDWKQRARSWEAKSKENKAALDAANAELEELRVFKQRAEAAEAEAEAMRAEKERLDTVSKVAKEKNLPERLMFGSDADEMAANADAINEYIAGIKPNAPTLFKDTGAPINRKGGDSEKVEYVRALFGNS